MISALVFSFMPVYNYTNRAKEACYMKKILVESPCLLHGGKLGMFSNGSPLFRKMDNRNTA